jgi:predicted NBD/HSP70 family sugar kinase
LNRAGRTIIGDRRARGVAADELRRHNLGLLLERLHLSNGLTRSKLTSATGLNRSTIADLIGELTALGVVEELAGAAPSGPGRPSPLARVRPEGAIALAVELAVDSVAVATVGLGGHVYNRVRVARPRGRFSPEETVQDVAKLAEPLVAALPAGHSVSGVGVGVVGIVRRSDGYVELAPNLGWHGVALAEMLAAELRTSAPVLVANDADLGALGVYRRGTDPAVTHLIYIVGEVGIGTGVIANGRPMLGAAGYAGEAGHMLINPTGRKCRCGAVGCWETEAGEAALLRHAGMRVAGTGLGVVDGIVERAVASDKATLRAVAEVGKWLGIGIGNLVNVFNPQLVVLGGLYNRLFPFLEGPVRDGMATRVLEAPGDMVEVSRSELGLDAALIGAAELALMPVVSDPAAALAGARKPATA